MLLMLQPATLQAAGRIFSVEEIEEIKDRWVGLQVTVEGRWSSYDSQAVRLRNCTLAFRSEKPLPPLFIRSGNLEITGLLSKHDGKRYEVLISSVKETPRDLDRLEELKRLNRRATPQDWYNLANWANRRGTFYRDSALLAAGQECRRRGFQMEQQQMPLKDPAARVKLAERAKSLSLPVSLQQELLHESFWLRREVLQREPEPRAIQQWLDDLVRDLPGAASPPNGEQNDLLDLRKTYLGSPYKTYAEAMEPERRKLHRILWANLALPLLERGLAEDKSNGFEIARLIDEQLPEFHQRAEELRDAALSAQAAQVEQLSKLEMLKLRDTYIERQQPAAGTRVVESWLRVREKKLLPGDIEGAMHHAQLYTELLERPEVTRQKLLALGLLYPDQPELSEKLQQMGFRKQGKTWITLQQYENSTDARFEQALRAGRVEVGMTADMVRRSLGAPNSRARVSSGGEFHEIWSYVTPGTTQQLTIFLVRRWNETESLVVSIDQIQGG